MTLNQILKATRDRISFNVVLEILCKNLQSWLQVRYFVKSVFKMLLFLSKIRVIYFLLKPYFSSLISNFLYFSFESIVSLVPGLSCVESCVQLLCLAIQTSGSLICQDRYSSTVPDLSTIITFIHSILIHQTRGDFHVE